MFTQPTKEHEWLKRFVGEWKMEGQCMMGPDKPAEKSRGTERVRMLGDLWLIGEGEMEMPGGAGVGKTMMTLGFDPAKKKFVGTWVGSMMGQMFVYEGEIDADMRILPLNTTGPSFTDPAKTARYQDVVELHGNDKRLLWSQCQNDDGSWTRFMTATYTRVK
jgi:hypothetical protein